MVKQVIVVRKDLNMRKGKMCAQVAHASFKVFLGSADNIKFFENRQIRFLYDENSAWDEWLNGQFTKVVVSCDTRDELFDLYRQAVEADLPCAMITDAGKTEFHGEPTETTIAIGPGNSEDIDKITGHLKLI